MGDPAIRNLVNPDPNEQASPSTSLSCFIHVTRLRRIESEIQQSIYRVDEQTLTPPTTINSFLCTLESWKERIPPDFEHQDTEYYSYDGRWYYEIYHFQCLRFLLFPQIIRPDRSMDMIIKCAEACGGLCRTYKSLHGKTSVGFSLMALYSIFLAGLTLLYCIWLSPREIYSIPTSNDLNSCSIVLYIITERWPGAKKYRDAFEVLKQSILSKIAGGNNARVPIPGLGQDNILNDIMRGRKGLYPEGRLEFGRMMSDMTGGAPQPSGQPASPIHRRYTAPDVHLQQYQQPPPQYPLSNANPFTIPQQYSPTNSADPPYGPVIRSSHLADYEYPVQNLGGMQSSTSNPGFTVHGGPGGGQLALGPNNEFLDYDMGALMRPGGYSDDLP
jgi:hypothetical protein